MREVSGAAENHFADNTADATGDLPVYCGKPGFKLGFFITI